MSNGLFKRILNKLINHKITSEEYISILRKKGIKVGEGTRIFDPNSTTIDMQNPSMLKIGKNVRITKGCTVLTHDYSWSVLAGVYGECLGGIGPVTIGDNVFIGMYSIVLKGTTIGDNVIIGAGSVVNGMVESNSVYAGVPAKRIMSLNDYYRKKKENYENEAKTMISMYKEANRSLPDKSVLKEYFWLFTERDEAIDKEYEGLMRRTGYYDLCKKNFIQSKPKWDGFASLLKSLDDEGLSEQDSSK